MRLGKFCLGKLLSAGLAAGLALTAFGPARADDLTVGFIYVGPKDDFGYNQSHAEGAAELAKEVPGVKILEEERVPETIEVEKTMESMINLDGATLLFPTSFGYFNPHILNMAKKYPDVTFLHCGGLYSPGMPDNVGSYFGYIDECEYLAGIVAGHTSKTGKLGFIGAKPIPQVLRDINAYELGAKTVNPAITTTVIFTGDWSMPVKEAEAAETLANQGIDVLTCHVDSPKVIMQTAERRGIYCTGYHCSQAALAPKGYLTGAEWNWGKVYVDYVNMIKAGQKWPHVYRGGLKDGIVKCSPYGPAVSDDAKKDADAVKAKFMTGDYVIFKGPLKDNTGAIVIPDGTSEIQTDPELEKMNYLVDGVVGSTGAK